MAWALKTATDYKDCLSQIIEFVTKAFEAGAVTAGGGDTGDGIVYGASASENSAVETWTLICTTGGGDDVAIFSVSGSVSGAQTASTCGIPYSVDEVSFILLGGDTDFIAGDSFTFGVTATTALWAVNESDLASTQQYVMLQGVGGGSDEIFAGFRTKSDAATYYNLEVTGFSGYLSGLSYSTQPGFRSYYTCAVNVSFQFYIWMTGRHIKIVPLIGTVWGGGYTGWFLPTATTSQYNYPQFVGGSTDDASQLVGGAEDDHTNYWRSYSDEYSGAVNDGSQWREINRINPMNYSSFSTWVADLDGDRVLYPATLIEESLPVVYGTLDGIYCVPNGDGAVAAGNVINIVTKGLLAVQDVFRVGGGNIAAFDLIGDV